MVRVVVIGGGVNGVGSALSLLRLRPECDVTILAEAFTPNTTGDVAAGLWEPFHSNDTPEEKVIQWSQGTWNLYCEWYRKGESKARGLSIVHTTNLSKSDAEASLPYWHHIPFHYSLLTQDELAKYGPKYKSGSKFTTFTAEPSTFLPSLLEEVKTRGGHIQTRRLSSLHEAATHADLIINCTGVGARDLTPDPSVYPCRGQVMRVNAPWVTDALTYDWNTTYIIPNQGSVVLGGTLDENNWSLKVDKEVSKSIWERCTSLLPSLKSAKVVEEWVGLRPFRRGGVRLEEDQIKVGNREVPVIHNYGHGGCGVTLFWGCGQEVARIASRIIDQHYGATSKL